ncbi:hypothetical protein [Aurantimonas sp. VKM B-3413]|uniref:hypothetical protein n=1 Tax=Aurantimonas sp. VKM B-3413 TaxID=2779401 RepID=UPI001E5CF0C6|nr:hypothetical protein [Aurantimonas sp. VKM B-3413]MCB8840034.1 hypothetical protein [Aurantimonas sp. VKM B-3413]
MGRKWKSAFLLLGAAMSLLLWGREPILFVLGIPGTVGDAKDWFRLLTADNIAIFYAILNTGLAGYFFFDDRLFGYLVNKKLRDNPSLIRTYPSYEILRLKYGIENSLSPQARAIGSRAEFQEKIDAALKGDYESYLLSINMAEWVVSAAVKYWGHGQPHYAEVQSDVLALLDKAHAVITSKFQSTDVPEPSKPRGFVAEK